MILALPRFIESPNGQNLTQGSDIILYCNGSGNPSPRVVWIKDGIILNNITVDSIAIGRNALIIRNSTESDRGSYRCLLRNRVGQITSHAALVDIYSKFNQ